MAEISEDDPSKPFDRMVPIRVTGGSRMIGTTAEAARELLERWPEHGLGSKHLAARRACLRVLEGKAPAIRARQALEAAAREAQILGDGLLESLAKAVKQSGGK